MSEPERNEEERGFKVQDRRRFTASGEARAPGGPADPAAGADPADTAAPPAATGHEPLPEISFTTFAISLSTQALVHLGEVEDPLTHTSHTDLDAARQLIDILGMLRDKTRGNLDGDEERLLDAILYDLRLRFVERTKRAPGA